MKLPRLASSAGGIALATAATVTGWPSDGRAQGVPAEPSATTGEKPPPGEGPAAGDTAEESEDWRQYTNVELGPITLSPVVLIAAQAMPYVGDDSFFQAGDMAEQEGFRLRRARFGLAGDVLRKVSFAFSAELSSSEDGTLRIHDAWLGYTQFDWLRAFAGARAVPYSRSALTRSGNTALIERPLAVRAMAPQHQVGVSLDGELWDGALGYTAGVYNGLQRSQFFYDGYVENYSPFGNRFDGLAYAARIRSDPLGRLDPTIADEHHSPVRFGVGASLFFSDGGARDVLSAGGDALLHAYGFHLLAEALWSQSQPEAVPTQPSSEVEQVASFAIVGETGYMILKDTLGVSGRFEWIDPNTNTDDEGDNWLITAGASYQVVDRLLRLQAEYTHREEMHGLSLANDSVTLQAQLQLSALAGREARRDDADEQPPAALTPEVEADVVGPSAPRGDAEAPVREGPTAKPAAEGEEEEAAEPPAKPDDEEAAEEEAADEETEEETP